LVIPAVLDGSTRPSRPSKNSRALANVSSSLD
jgi:hypothetical protein